MVGFWARFWRLVWGWRLSGRKFQRFIGTTVHMGVPGVLLFLQRRGLIRLRGWFRSVVASSMLRVVLSGCAALCGFRLRGCTMESVSPLLLVVAFCRAQVQG